MCRRAFTLVLRDGQRLLTYLLLTNQCFPCLIQTNRGIQTKRTIKTPPILYERPHNYDWSIRACLVVQKEDEKKGCKQTNQQTIIDISLTYFYQFILAAQNVIDLNQINIQRQLMVYYESYFYFHDDGDSVSNLIFIILMRKNIV